MDNIELEKKIKEIISIENYFDMVIAAKDFEKDYKTSDFFKATRKPLGEVIKEAKMYYMSQLADLQKKAQVFIDGLDLTKLSNLITEWGDKMAEENQDVLNTFGLLKDLVPSNEE